MRAKGQGETANKTSKPCLEILPLCLCKLHIGKTQTSVTTYRKECVAVFIKQSKGLNNMKKFTVYFCSGRVEFVILPCNLTE